MEAWELLFDGAQQLGPIGGWRTHRVRCEGDHCDDIGELKRVLHGAKHPQSDQECPARVVGVARVRERRPGQLVRLGDVEWCVERIEDSDGRPRRVSCLTMLAARLVDTNGLHQSDGVGLRGRTEALGERQGTHGHHAGGLEVVGGQFDVGCLQPCGDDEVDRQ